MNRTPIDSPLAGPNRLITLAHDAPPADYPSATLSNDFVKLNLYLPDERHGFYRGSRFDRSGMVASATWNGHTFFGPWNDAPADPFHHDHVQGTAEEFSMDDPPGFSRAAVNESFLKIGVGLLRRPNEHPYAFHKRYAITDPGRWEVHINDACTDIAFEHVITDQLGWAYRYRKQIELLADQPGFVIRRTLENTGTRRIDTLHYGHNFIAIDDQQLGPGWELRLPYEVTVKDPNKLHGYVAVDGRAVSVQTPIPAGKSAWAEFVAGGELSSPDAPFTMSVTDPAGTSVQIDLDPAPQFVRLFATPRVVCPEGFVRIIANPGEVFAWSSRYLFSTPA